jgi:hypothetical protein
MVHTALGGATELSASDIDLMTVPHCHRQTAIKAWHRLDWVDPPQKRSTLRETGTRSLTMTAAALRGMQIWEASGPGQGLDWLGKRG